MLRSTDFSNLTSKVILFTSDIAFDQGQALAALLADLQGIFNGQITTLPLPPGAPGEIPRITLGSSDEIKSLEAGPERLSILFHAKDGKIETVDDQVNLALRSLAAYKVALKCRISRLAINVSHIFAIPNPAMVIARYFCKEKLLERRDDFKGALSRTEKMELHAHKRFDLKEGLTVNSWVRIKTLLQQQDQSTGILVEQDINTLGERANTADFSNDEIDSIIREMFSESRTIMKLYFEGV